MKKHQDRTDLAMVENCVKKQNLAEPQTDDFLPVRKRKHALSVADQVRFRQLLLEASNAFFAAAESQQPENAAVCRNQIDVTTSALKKALHIVEQFGDL